ncbi:MAG TPA: hypothetical protein VGB74_05815 [Actinoplanes sp.]|jgi:hypothetical protein
MTTEQIRESGERVTETARHFGRQSIDAYEQVVNSAVDFERATADAAPADWIKNAIGAHAKFVADVNAAYVGALRSIVN